MENETNGSFSGISQGLVLGQQLFTIYFNYTEEGAECRASKFADNLQSNRRASIDEDIVTLQQVIDC